MRRLVDWTLDGLALLLAVVVLGGALSLFELDLSTVQPVRWIGMVADILVHFQIVYALVLAVLAPLLAWRRRWLSLLLALGLATVLAPAFAPYLPRAAPTQAPQAASLRVMTFNARFGNEDFARTAAWLRAADLDVVFLTELNATWWRGLDDLRAQYPHQVRARSWSAILSRQPITRVDTSALPGGSTGVAGRICREHARCVLIMGLHLSRPVTSLLVAIQRGAFAATIDVLRRYPDDAHIVLGDFNMTPWTRRYRDLLARANLIDSAVGRFPAPTWGPRGWLHILPIDHILHSRNVTVLERQVGPDLGSDHLPIRAHLGM
jgi:endonuclease/exonuclease/phosphatase (EEP) superfamily protein YafD